VYQGVIEITLSAIAAPRGRRTELRIAGMATGGGQAATNMSQSGTKARIRGCLGRVSFFEAVPFHLVFPEVPLSIAAAPRARHEACVVVDTFGPGSRPLLEAQSDACRSFGRSKFSDTTPRFEHRGARSIHKE